MSRHPSAAAAALALALLAACAPAGPTPVAAPTPAVAGASGQAPGDTVSERLFFGRSIPGGDSVTEAQWEAFVREVVTPRFPAGFTVWRADGQWRGDDGQVGRERTMVVEVVHAASLAADSALGAIARAYVDRHRQEAVMRVTAPAARHFYSEAGDARPVSPRFGSARSDVQFITPAGDWPYPFSPAVRVGDLIFLSGQIGARMEQGQMVLVPGGIEAETRQTLENVREKVEQAGSSIDRVVKCTVMLADMAEWPRMNAVYAAFFPGPKPARSALGANGLALGARVEIECIAVAGRG